MNKSIALTAATAIFAVGGVVALTTQPALADNHTDGKKVWVCKFVQKPGENEVLKAGKNPIEVSFNSTEFKEYRIGAEFKDGQERSVVVGLDSEPDPGVGACTPLVATPSPSPTPTPTPTPTPSKSSTPKPKPTPKPSKGSTSTATAKATTTPRGVPAVTGAEGDATGLALLGLAGATGVAASATALVARRKR